MVKFEGFINFLILILIYIINKKMFAMWTFKLKFGIGLITCPLSFFIFKFWIKRLQIVVLP